MIEHEIREGVTTSTCACLPYAGRQGSAKNPPDLLEKLPIECTLHYEMTEVFGSEYVPTECGTAFLPLRSYCAPPTFHLRYTGPVRRSI